MSSPKRFPQAKYGRQRLQFFPAPSQSQLRAFAALVFPWSGSQVLICDIETRGWTIPSGRVEPEESSLEAAIREAREEAGVELSDCQYIGCFRISGRTEVRWADCFVAKIASFGEIEKREESLGRKLVTLEELPDLYHEWSPMIDMVFRYSQDVLTRSLGSSHERN